MNSGHHDCRSSCDLYNEIIGILKGGGEMERLLHSKVLVGISFFLISWFSNFFMVFSFIVILLRLQSLWMPVVKLPHG